jgi:hypothetical protein
MSDTMNWRITYWRDIWHVGDEGLVVTHESYPGEVVLMSKVIPHFAKEHHNYARLELNDQWVGTYKRDAESRDWAQMDV